MVFFKTAKHIQKEKNWLLNFIPKQIYSPDFMKTKNLIKVEFFRERLERFIWLKH